MINQVPIIDMVKRYAIQKHNGVNHYYDRQPYSVHLEKVVDLVNYFISEIPQNDRKYVICAAWGHDLIEDCRVTYNDVKINSNEIIANIIYALSNEKGKTRKERGNAKYYKGIRRTKYATLVKLCDRIANVEYSKQKKSRMFEVYKNENERFVKALKKRWWEKLFYKENDYKEVFNYLNKIFEK